MDKIITGILGIGLFILFVGGLAETIGKLPFVLIIILICGMALYAFYEELKASRD